MKGFNPSEEARELRLQEAALLQRAAAEHKEAQLAAYYGEEFFFEHLLNEEVLRQEARNCHRKLKHLMSKTTDSY